MFFTQHSTRKTRKTKLKAGDKVLLLQSFTGGKLEVRIKRDKELLRWSNGQEVEIFFGIHSVSELERSMAFVARMLGLNGVQKCEPDPDLQRLGWKAFQLV